jgi:hypothetical protein
MKDSARQVSLTFATCTFCAAILGYGLLPAVVAQQQSGGDGIYQAIRTNDLVGLRRLVNELGVNAEDGSGLMPLTLAAAFGTREAVSVLVDAGADVKAQNRSGLTALHVAWQDESVIRQEGCQILRNITPSWRRC